MSLDGRNPIRRRAALGTAVLLLLFAAAPFAAVLAAPGSQGADAAIDLNQADAQALATIPGIGETMARRIVEWRDEHGPFRRVEDLLKVKGIGEKSFEKLRPHVKVAAAR